MGYVFLIFRKRASLINKRNVLEVVISFLEKTVLGLLRR